MPSLLEEGYVTLCNDEIFSSSYGSLSTILLEGCMWQLSKGGHLSLFYRSISTSLIAGGMCHLSKGHLSL